MLALNDTVQHATKGCGKVVKIDDDGMVHVEVPAANHGDPNDGGLSFSPSVEKAAMSEWELCIDKLFNERDKSEVPSSIKGYPIRIFQTLPLAYVTSRPYGIPKTWICIYSLTRQIGKSDLVEYMVNILGALVIDGLDLAKDKKAILKKWNVAEGDEHKELTPFQKKPIFILALTADDDRLKHKRLYQNLEEISDGSFLKEGGWGKNPPHLFAIGNDHLDPNRMSGRLHAFLITKDYSMLYNMNFQAKVGSKRKVEELMSDIEEKVCTTGKNRENLIFEELFVGQGKITTLKFTDIIDQMIDVEGPTGFWSKYRFMKGGKESYRKTDFKSWMSKYYPNIEMTEPKNVPHYKVQEK